MREAAPAMRAPSPRMRAASWRMAKASPGPDFRPNRKSRRRSPPWSRSRRLFWSPFLPCYAAARVQPARPVW